MTTIYKKDTKGKIRYIKIWTEGAWLHQESGIVGTDSPVPHKKECKAKNVGRSNETTPEDQAISELNSFVAEKLKGEYRTTAKELEGEEIILPMLAKSYKDEARKVDWTTAFSQPKLDGMRALFKDGQFVSREGTVITTVPHLTEALKGVEGHLDGELYAHGLTFQENMRLIKKHRPGESEQIIFHIYDVVSDKPYKERYKLILEAAKGHKDFINVVGTSKVSDEKELKKAHAANLAKGYEGTILRWGGAPYKPNGRSSNLLKYKDFLDLACVIKDIVPCDQRPEWGKPVFERGGKTFESGMKYSHDARKEFLINKKKYIGKVAELRFFEYTEAGIPRFPVMVGIRLDKKKGD